MSNQAPYVNAFIPICRGNNRLEVKNSGEEAVDLLIIGSIGKSWWDDSGITEKEVRDALNSIPKGRSINARINSEGGSVQEGLGIYNAFKERRSDITAHITGYALSIASVFPLGAGRVVSPKSAIWMMHKAWAWTSGNADDMRASADMLEAHDETLIDVYAAETGKSKAEIRTAMDNETWIKGADAVGFGLADETDPEEEPQAANFAYRPLPENYLNRCKVPAEILNALKTGHFPKSNQPTIMNTPSTATPPAAPAIPAAAPVAAPAAEPSNVLAEVREQLRVERMARITAEVTRRAENKIVNANLQWWIDRAMQDESGTFAQIAALPSAHVGAEPLGPGRIEITDGAMVPGFQGKRCLDEVQNMFQGIPESMSRNSTPAGQISYAQARYDLLKDNWPMLMAKARAKDQAFIDRNGVMPVAANTFSASLTTNFLITGAVTQLSPKFAPLRAFARDNSVDPYKPLATGQMKFTQSSQDGTDVQTNETNWETAGHSDSTVNNVQITVSQYSSIMHVTNSELNSGLRMEDLVTAKLATLGAKVTQVIVTPITAANFTATPVIIAPAAFGFSDMATLWGQLKKAAIKNLILDGEYLARIINNPTLFQATPVVPGAGWKNVNGWDFVGLNTDWSAAGSNVRGFACDPQAIGVIQGLPLNPPEGIPGNTLMLGQFTLPGVDVSIATYVWFSLATRTLFASYDLMLGAAKLDATAGVVVASGTPT